MRPLSLARGLGDGAWCWVRCFLYCCMAAEAHYVTASRDELHKDPKTGCMGLLSGALVFRQEAYEAK